MEFRELLPRRRMVRNYAPEPVSREASSASSAPCGARRAPATARDSASSSSPRTSGERRSLASRARAGRRTRSSSPGSRARSARVRVRPRGRLSRALPAGGQAGRRPGDRVARPVLVRRRRRRAHAHPPRGDRRGSRCRAVRRSQELADRLRASFGIPDDIVLVAHVTIGVPAPDPGWSAVTSRRTKPRRAETDSIRWERW